MTFDTENKSLIDPYDRLERWAKMKQALKEGKIYSRGNCGHTDLKTPTGLPTDKNKAIYDFLIACEKGETSKRRSNGEIGELRLLRIVSILVNVGQWYKPSFDKADHEQFKKMLDNLDADKIKQENKRPYQTSSKTHMKKLMLKFWRWLATYYKKPELYVMADEHVRYQEKELKPDAESKDKIWNIAEKLKFNDGFTIKLLFDGGFRATEAINIRFRDVKEKTDEMGDHYYFVNIRDGTSKTEGRPVSVRLCTKEIDDYLKLNRDKINSIQPFLPHTSNSLKVMLYRMGNQYLKKPLSVTLLRHCSMTHYAPILKNDIRLTTRYGEVIGSRAIRHYIKHSGILEEETAQEIKLDEQTKIRKENDKLKQKMAMMEEMNDSKFKRIETIEKEAKEKEKIMEELKKRLDKIEKIDKIIEKMGGIDKIPLKSELKI